MDNNELSNKAYIRTCSDKELVEILFRMIIHGSVIRPDREYIQKWLEMEHTKGRSR